MKNSEPDESLPVILKKGTLRCQDEESFSDQLKKELLFYGISMDKERLSLFYRYYQMIITKNRMMNLTTITEPSDVITKHFSDSLSLLKIYSIEGNCSVIDVGTGAGFPGIPLKIVFPEIKLTLLDSLGKRVNFLEEVCSTLSLPFVTCIHGRAEDVGHLSAHREQYDLCVSRAVANLTSLAEYCLPFVKIGGLFVSYKSVGSSEEIDSAQKAITLLGGNMVDVCSFKLPCSDTSRCLIKILKKKETPIKYPRKAGIPSRKPLK